MRNRAHKLVALLMALCLCLGMAEAASALYRPAGIGLLSKGLVRQVKFKKTSGTVKLKPTRNGTLNLANSVVVTPASAENRALSWASSDEGVAKVNQAGLVLVLGEGAAKITATATDGSLKRASYKLKVTATRVSKVTIDKSLVTLDINDTHAISAKVSPSSASYAEVRYATSDDSIAKVSGSGVVTAKGAGIATISVMSDNPNKPKTVTCKIRVRSKKPDTFKISAVGDVIPGGDKERGTLEQFKKYLKKYAEETGTPYNGMLMNAAKYFRQTDVTIANLECTISSSSGYEIPGKYKFKGQPEWLQVLSLSGIQMVNVANNHTEDYGSGGYENTKSNVRKYGMGYSGRGYKESSIQTIKGIKVGFIGFQTGRYGATPYEIGRDVRKLKREADAVIVSFHFCDVPEYTYKVTGKMKNYARTAVNAGADLVVGHHPHVISGMENYKGVTIAYGLGSFLSVGPNPIRPRRTFILQQTIKVHPGFTETADVRVVPFWITSDEETNDMRPSYAPGDEPQAIKKMIDRYSIGTPVDYTLVGNLFP